MKKKTSGVVYDIYYYFLIFAQIEISKIIIFSIFKKFFILKLKLVKFNFFELQEFNFPSEFFSEASN